MKKTLKFLSLLLAVFAVACNTPEEPEQPNNNGNNGDNGNTEQPADPNAVTMSDIRIDGILDVAIDFSVTVRNMDDYGYVLIPASEYTEVDVDYVIANSLTRPYDIENTSWEEDLVIALSADTAPETEYVIVMAAKNSTSSVMKTTTATSLEKGMDVEKISFHPTEVNIESNGTNHLMTMSTARYQLRVTLVGSEVFGGRYDNTMCVEESCVCDTQCTEDVCVCEKIENGFIAEGAYFKVQEFDGTWTEYTKLDPTIGNVDFYENVVTGKWEIYGTFCFILDEETNSWLTIEIESPQGIVIESKKRTEPYEFIYPIADEDGNIVPLSAEAEKSQKDANVWNITVAQDKDNSLTFTLNLGEDKAYIPSGTYTVGDKLTGCSMVVNNVATSLATADQYESKLVVEYNEATEETIVSADVMVKSGTAVVKFNNAGPFKLYEEETYTEFEVYTEGESINSMAIWTTWDDSGYYWLECLGTYFNINLYFMTGTDVEDHLPAGRYYLRSSAPADGSLWIDCTRSNATRIRTDEGALQFACDNDTAYIDVTAEYDEVDEFWRHSIVGTLETTNGKYQILLNYVKENPSIY